MSSTSEPDVVGRELPVAARLQILATEHWSLLSTRSLSWNESFSRASMFLSAVSGSIVALALVAQASSFGREFLWFALVILSIVLCLGVATFARLIDVNGEDLLWVQGMNRLRRAYVELAPDLAQFLVASSSDDDAGVLRTLGATPSVNPLYHHVLVTTPAIVGVIDAAVAGAAVACLTLLVGLPPASTAALAIFAFALTEALLLRWQLRAVPIGSHGSALRRPPGRRQEVAG